MVKPWKKPWKTRENMQKQEEKAMARHEEVEN